MMLFFVTLKDRFGDSRSGRIFVKKTDTLYLMNHEKSVEEITDAVTKYIGTAIEICIYFESRWQEFASYSFFFMFKTT